MAIDRDATLKQAEKLLRQGRLDAAIAEYVRLVEDQPRDWNVTNALGDLYLRAGRTDEARQEFTRAADQLLAEGFLPRSSALFKKVLRIAADDEHTLAQLADIASRQEIFVDAKRYLKQIIELRRAKGDGAGAGEIAKRIAAIDPSDPVVLEFLTADDAGDDPKLLLALARRDFQQGRLEDGRTALTRVLTTHPGEREIVMTLAIELASHGRVDEAFAIVDLVADCALIDGDCAGAAAALQTFARVTPTHLDACLKLVEICVDGNLDSELMAAQQQLTDAYLSAEFAAEARAVAEDLVSRHGSPDNVDRLRRALVMAGEADPDEIIAGVSAREALFAEDELELAQPMVAVPEDPLPALTPEPDVAPGATSTPDAVEAIHPDTAIVPNEDVTPIDVGLVLPAPSPDAQPRGSHEEPRTDPPPPVHVPEPVAPIVKERAEVDLTSMLSGLKNGPAPAPVRSSLDEMFDQLRDRTGEVDGPRRQLHAGVGHLQAGRFVEALPLLEAAARVPQLRFEASAALGRLFVSRGDAGTAIDWFGRAAESPAPTPEASHALLYELSVALEGIGEDARALAVLLELSLDAPTYRDVQARVDRLTRAQEGSPP